jgi:prepilin-type N-terminal cleavage/methylation domain-containing protein
MTFNPLHPTAARRRRSGFTLAEVLAALLLMAIVVPVAMQGLRVAGTAGEVGQRKMVAARLGNKVLNELKVTGQLQNSGQTGVAQDRGINYRWTVKNQPWTQDTLSQMTVATITVSFLVQGKNYDVHLSTLTAPQQQNANFPGMGGQGIY